MSERLSTRTEITLATVALIALVFALVFCLFYAPADPSAVSVPR